MRWSMSWNDAVKAAAIAAQAERTATAGRVIAEAPWSWNPHDVWLSRIKQSREFTAQPSQAVVSGPTTRSRQDSARQAGLRN
jgi:hypothetical protein